VVKLIKFLAPLALLLLAVLLWRYSAPRPEPSATPAPSSALAPPGPDAEAALNPVRRMPPGRERTQSVLALLDTLSRRDPDRALALARELITTRDERAFYSALFDRLARENLATTLPRLAAVPAGESRENALRALADVWVRADFAAALGWAQTLSAPDRSVALETVLLDLAPRDPSRAIQLAQDNLAGDHLGRVVLRALPVLAASDPPGAARLVTLLPAGESQIQAAVDVARAFGARQPEAAVAWSATLPPGPTQTLALNSALASWAERDPAAAANYAVTLPAGPLQESASRYAASLFGARDAPRAIAWAQSLPPGVTRARALTQIVSEWARRDPPGATRWTAAQPELPLAALRGTLSYWRLQDAAAAQAWLETATLPAEMKAQLRGGAR
jgi:hypothetical protein